MGSVKSKVCFMVSDLFCRGGDEPGKDKVRQWLYRIGKYKFIKHFWGKITRLQNMVRIELHPSNYPIFSSQFSELLPCKYFIYCNECNNFCLINSNLFLSPKLRNFCTPCRNKLQLMRIFRLPTRRNSFLMPYTVANCHHIPWMTKYVTTR